MDHLGLTCFNGSCGPMTSAGIFRNTESGVKFYISHFKLYFLGWFPAQKMLYHWLWAQMRHYIDMPRGLLINILDRNA
jgi:hypothetical protein